MQDGSYTAITVVDADDNGTVFAALAQRIEPEPTRPGEYRGPRGRR
jgi:hypothetical protein